MNGRCSTHLILPWQRNNERLFFSENGIFLFLANMFFYGSFYLFIFLAGFSAPILVLPLQTSLELCFIAQMIFFSIDDKEKHSLDRVQFIEGLTLKK